MSNYTAMLARWLAGAVLATLAVLSHCWNLSVVQLVWLTSCLYKAEVRPDT